MVVRADAVTKRWGQTTALSGVTCEIGPGVTGLLGANGAGKTTLLGLILGMHPPDSGALTVLDEDPWTAGRRVRARLGYAPEHDALPPDVAAHEIVRHLAEVHGLPRRAATERASDVLWEVGLAEERFRAVGTMSTGQRQRVKLAQAIAHDPEMVLLDEPTSGLDPVQREEMLELIRGVARRLGIHVVLSSHLLEEVERVSDAVLILDHGRVTASGRLDDLRVKSDEIVLDVDAADPGVVARLADAIERRGLPVRRDGWRLVCAAADDAALDTIRDEMAACPGAGIRRLQRRRASLEDVFLAAGEGATP